MDTKGKIALLALTIAAVAVSTLLANSAFAAFTNTGLASTAKTSPAQDEYSNGSWPRLSLLDQGYAGRSERVAGHLPVDGWRSSMAAGAKTLSMHRGLSTNPYWRQNSSGNVTIDSAKAKALVEADIPSFRVGTIIAFRNGWFVPIEDGKGVVMSIQVTKVSAPTAEQAKAVVEESLKKGWKAGEPRLIRATYNVPLLDSSGTTIGYVRVDGRSGEIVRRPSTILTVTSEQAKTIVSNAIKEFRVSESKEWGGAWVVSITYKDKVVMTILLGKINTPTSENAVKAVQESLEKGWKAGETKQLRLIYSVPIIDANNNTIGSIRVDGRTGDIITGFPPLRR